MSTAEHGQGSGAQVAPSTTLALQCVSSVAATMIGEALGDTLVEKLLAGLLLCVIGAFLMAPGRHRRRRVVAVALFVALLAALRRAGDALASTGRERSHEPLASSLVPANWLTVAVATTVGFGLGSLGTTAIDGWARDPAPATVAVPAVAGKRAADARALLEQSGLAAVRSGAPSVSVPPGRAIRTSPAGGARVRRGSSITLFVSTGSPGRLVRVPAIRGLPERDARSLLEDLGLRVTRRETPSGEITRGEATGSSPPANARVQAGSRVTLLVSSGAPDDEQVVVPGVADLPRVAALARLRAAGLDPTPRPRPSDDVPSGRAIATDPPAGERVDRGASVQLLVSSGSQVERIAVPRLVGDSIDEARDRLGAIGLRAQTVREDSSEAAGTVLRTEPRAGSLVVAGTTVRLAVSSGTLVRVPDVVGDDDAAAQRTLTSVGLTAAATYLASPKPSGTVTQTDPAAGTEVPRGARVAVSVSCGPNGCVE